MTATAISPELNIEAFTFADYVEYKVFDNGVFLQEGGSELNKDQELVYESFMWLIGQEFAAEAEGLNEEAEFKCPYGDLGTLVVRFEENDCSAVYWESGEDEDGTSYAKEYYLDTDFESFVDGAYCALKGLKGLR